MYFVESVPESCMMCDCCHTREYNRLQKIDGDKFCGIENTDINYNDYLSDYRPEWCPLKRIPDRQENYIADFYHQGYADGWNDLIDKMLKE